MTNKTNFLYNKFSDANITTTLSLTLSCYKLSLISFVPYPQYF